MQQTITYEEFERHILDIKAITEFREGLSELSRKFSRNNEEDADFLFPTLVTNTIDLLAKITDDKFEWIDYFIFELDFGKLSDDFEIKDKDGNDIPLRTIKDLWNILSENK